MSVMEQSTIDPKTSVLVKVFRDFGLNLSPPRSNFDTIRCDLYDSASIYSGLEVWKLSDVVFLDDSPSILGRVIAIDRQQVVVDCDFTGSNHDNVVDNNATKSTLKVFRLVDLESCIEGPEYQHKTCPKNEGETSKNVAMATGDIPSASHTGIREVSQSAISRHVAGTVQHRPVCILDPNLTRNLDMSVSDSIPHPSDRLRGLSPLAVQATDSGPNLLVERISDRLAFLVSSAHSTTSALSVSSFVAIGNRDTKVKKCTISEEAVNSVEAGLTPNQSLVQAIRTLSNQFKTSLETNTTNSTGSKSVGMVASGNSEALPSIKTQTRSRKGKDTLSQTSRKKRSTKHVHFLRPQQVAMDTDTSTASSSTVVPNSVSSTTTNCKFVPLSTGHPDIFFLTDHSGTIFPLLDGLSLKTTTAVDTSNHSSGSNCSSQHSLSLPLQSYRCINSRKYQVQGQDTIVVFALGQFIL